MNVIGDWKKMLGADWDKTYAASNTIYVARQNNILFSVLAQYFGPEAINDRLMLIETISFTTTPADMLTSLTRIIADRSVGRAVLRQLSPDGLRTDGRRRPRRHHRRNRQTRNEAVPASGGAVRIDAMADLDHAGCGPDLALRPEQVRKASSHPHSCELQLVLEPARSELVRAFVREAALAEDVPLPLASLLADDAAQTWLSLCALGSGRERCRIVLLCARRDVRARILLPGYSRFSNVATSLAGCIRRDAGISCHERGIDGWEVSLHRSLTGNTEPAPSAAETPMPTPALAMAANDYLVELPQKTDAPGIARCFLEVYGHHYVHSEVFSSRRYWGKVESGELIPAVARDGQGGVIGHVALEREPGAHVAERGEAVVLPAYRGHHLLERMTERLSEEALKHGLQGIYAEPLTIHTFSQRNDERAGMPVCAVLLGANPEHFRPKDVPCPTAGQRQSYLRTFRFVQSPAARTVHAPEPYREMLLNIYASLGVSVSVATPSTVAAANPTPASRSTIAAMG